MDPYGRAGGSSAVRLLIACALLLALRPALAASAPAGWEAHAIAATVPYEPGRILVKFRARLDTQLKSSTNLQRMLGESLSQARSIAHVRPGDAPYVGGVDRIYELPVAADVDIPTLARKLSRLHEVEYAEPVYAYELVGTQELHRHLQAIPSDPAYADSTQRYLENLQLEAAWDIVKGETTSPVVCVIDGGTNWQHEDLSANMWVNLLEIPGNAIDDDNNGYVDDIHGWDFQAGDGNVRGDWSTQPSNANHGTHTGGLLAAVTNNSTGMASASWNPRLMAINASGNNDGSIGFGYSGIVYAAQNGADIVSLSWGGSAGSQALQNIIDFAVSQGVCVIGAAGNTNSNTPFFPAAYDGVVAVANVWGHTIEGIPASIPDTRYGGNSGSAYGGWIDVAAPGAAIYSTFDFDTTNQYGLSTGTSMSAPIAAAVAALIKSHNPTWGPLKVGEQLRITCDNINAQNPGFEDQLGRGRVNALRAVSESSPAVRIVDWTLDDADANGELNQGESVVVSIDVHNYHDAVLSPTFTLSTTSPYVTINDNTETATGLLLEDTGTSLPSAFTFDVSVNAPPGTLLDLRIDIAGSGYDDFQFIPIVLEPVFETHDVNNVEVSVTSTGNVGWVGFAGGLSGEKGVGFSFLGGPNLLFEGALLLGTSASSLSDAARIASEHTDFVTVNNAPPTKSTPGARADQEIVASYTDALNTTTPVGVRIDFESLAYASAPEDDFLLLCYQITNTGSAPLDGLRVGLWFDWDIDGNSFGSNRAGYDAARRLGYAWDQPGATPTAGLPFVGVVALTGPETAYSAIRNDGFMHPISIYNGFSKDDKWLVLNGTGVQQAGPTDISHAIASGPYLVEPGDSVLVCFALLAGDDLADLQTNADVAAGLFGDIETSVDERPPDVDGRAPRTLALGAAVPNPFNPRTRLELHVDRRRHVEVAIYAVRGHRLRTLIDGVLEPDVYTLSWDGTDDAQRRVASGVYFAHLRAAGVVEIRRMILAK